MARHLRIFVLLGVIRPLYGAPETDVVLYPHLVVGAGYQVVLQLANASDDPWSGTGRIPGFGRGSGVPWILNDQELEEADSFEIRLPKRATRLFLFRSRDDAGPFSSTLEIRPSTNSRITALASAFFYNYYQQEVLIDSIGVSPARPLTTTALPVEFSKQPSINTGVVLRRDSQFSNSVAPVMTARLFDEEGTLVQEVSEELLGARFFTEIFSNVGRDFEHRFVGSMVVTSPIPIYVTSLRQHLLSQGGFQLSTIPPQVESRESDSSSAHYELTFQATWSAATHPQSFPPNPHFSGLIGVVHNDGVGFWRAGGFASSGIESMAETGSKSPLNAEIQNAIDRGDASEIVSGSGIFPSPNSARVTFTATQKFPLLTLVSMIAPSPDWFVGVHDLPLFRNNRWVQELVVELLPYDAGTDSGTSYASPDRDTRPRQTIAIITGAPLASRTRVVPLGTFRLRRID